MSFIETHFFNSPNIPCAKELNYKYVVVMIACNDSDKIIKSVMESKKLHEECRACLGYPIEMESEPAWIRVDIQHIPNDLVG